jgi:hypothetical protein
LELELKDAARRADCEQWLLKIGREDKFRIGVRSEKMRKESRRKLVLWRRSRDTEKRSIRCEERNAGDCV